MSLRGSQVHIFHGVEHTFSDAVAQPNTYSVPATTHVFATVSRLLLLLYVADLRHNSTTDEGFAASLEPLETYLGSMEMPSSFIRLLGPKVTRMPGELGVSEYTTLAQVIIPYLYMGAPDASNVEMWAVLVKVRRKLSIQ